MLLEPVHDGKKVEGRGLPATCPPLPEMPAHKLNAVSGVGRRVASSGLPAIAMVACYFREMTSRRWQAGEAGGHPGSYATSQPEELSVVRNVGAIVDYVE